MKTTIIGVGNIVQIHIDALIEQKIDIAAHTEDAQTNAKGYSNHKEMLDNEKVDAVDICTSDHLHGGMVYMVV